SIGRARLHEEAAVHARRDRPAHVEPDPHPGLIGGCGPARETFEDPLSVHRADPGAVITYADDRVIGFRDGPELDGGSAGAVRDRVLQQVVEDLVEAGGIRT